MKHEVPDQALSLIGLEKERKYDVTKKDIKRFAQAIDDPNKLYYDDDYASKTKFKSIIAPLLFCQTFAFEDVALEELPPDGSPAEIDVPITANRAVGGGSVYEFHRRVRPGDQIKVRTKLQDIYTKRGKSGLLYFIVVETKFFNQHDEIVAKDTATFIKR